MHHSQDSDFNTEDEEQELLLYQKLYFESNDTCKISSSDKNRPTQIQDGGSLKLTVSENSDKPENCVSTDIVPSVDSRTLTPLVEVESSVVGCDSSHSRKKKGKKRLSSVCSEGSISGSQALDNLYCNDVEFDLNDSTFQDRLAIQKDSSNVWHCPNITDSKRLNKKRKYDTLLDVVVEEEEILNNESRCFSLVNNLAEKDSQYHKMCSNISNDDYAIDDDISSSESTDTDLYVLPPQPPKTYETLVVPSDDDDSRMYRNKLDLESEVSTEEPELYIVDENICRSNKGNKKAMVSPSRSNKGNKKAMVSPSKSKKGNKEAMVSPSKSKKGNKEAMVSPSKSKKGNKEAMVSPSKSKKGNKEAMVSPSKSKKGNKKAMVTPSSSKKGNQKAMEPPSRSTGNKKSEVPTTKEIHPRTDGKKKNDFTDKIICLSDSDSSEYDINESELSINANLTMNLSPDLQRYLKHTVVKETVIPHRKSTKDSSTQIKSIRHEKLYTGELKSCVDFSKFRPLTKKKPSCDTWTQEMATFYDSDVSENLNMDEIHQRMSDVPEEWFVVPADRLNLSMVNKRKRYFQDRCSKCRQFDHTDAQCSRVPHCHLCSSTSHKNRYSCPENCCFRCGGKPHVFCQDTSWYIDCSICQWKGHKDYICPDIWRRFHRTTSGDQPMESQIEPPIKPMYDAYCYACGERGHYGHDCYRRFPNSSGVPVPLSIASYESPLCMVSGVAQLNVPLSILPKHDVYIESSPLEFMIGLSDYNMLLANNNDIVKDIEHITDTSIQVKKLKNIQAKRVKKKFQVLINGEKDCCLQANDYIKVLLNQLPPTGYESFIKRACASNKDKRFIKLRESIDVTPSIDIISTPRSTISLMENYPIQPCDSKSLPRLKTKLAPYINKLKNSIKRNIINIKNVIKRIKDKIKCDYLTENDVDHFIEDVQRLAVFIYKLGMAEHQQLFNKLDECVELVRYTHTKHVSNETMEKVTFVVNKFLYPSREEFDHLFELAKRFIKKPKKLSKREIKNTKIKIKEDGTDPSGTEIKKNAKSKNKHKNTRRLDNNNRSSNHNNNNNNDNNRNISKEKKSNIKVPTAEAPDILKTQCHLLNDNLVDNTKTQHYMLNNNLESSNSLITNNMKHILDMHLGRSNKHLF